MPLPIAPILPINGVPDELLKAINDRLRRLEYIDTGAGAEAAADTTDGAIAHCW